MATLPSETGPLLLARIDLPRPGEAELGALSFNEDGDKILVGGQAWYGRRPTNCDLRSEILLKGVVTNSPLKGNTPNQITTRGLSGFVWVVHFGRNNPNFTKNKQGTTHCPMLPAENSCCPMSVSNFGGGSRWQSQVSRRSSHRM